MTGAFSHLFLTLFIQNVKIEYATRVFELFLLDGEDVLISAMVRIIHLMRAQILALDDYIVSSFVIGGGYFWEKEPKNK